MMCDREMPYLRALGLLLMLGCGGEARGSDAAFRRFNPGPAPQELHQGEVLYNTYCLSCHGLHGRGEGLGPPLLDSLYAPARLPDEAIFTAVERGVNQHNFHFGAMPPVKRLGRTEAEPVVGYVRWLQRRAGVGASLPSDTLGAR
jgi:mono/diheme cytochrome c family protein